jgi:hypothetical protein
MALKKKPAVRIGKPRGAKPKAPVFFCRDCGLEVTVTQGLASARRLVCCEQVMKRK